MKKQSLVKAYTPLQYTILSQLQTIDPKLHLQLKTILDHTHLFEEETTDKFLDKEKMRLHYKKINQTMKMNRLLDIHFVAKDERWTLLTVARSQNTILSFYNSMFTLHGTKQESKKGTIAIQKRRNRNTSKKNVQIKLVQERVCEQER